MVGDSRRQSAISETHYKKKFSTRHTSVVGQHRYQEAVLRIRIRFLRIRILEFFSDPDPGNNKILGEIFFQLKK